MLPVARNDSEWIWLVTNQPKGCTMQGKLYLLFNGQWVRVQGSSVDPNRILATGNRPFFLYKEL
jgi:hypothetical protein